jgi:hypothetical protein
LFSRRRALSGRSEAHSPHTRTVTTTVFPWNIANIETHDGVGGTESVEGTELPEGRERGGESVDGSESVENTSLPIPAAAEGWHRGDDWDEQDP